MFWLIPLIGFGAAAIFGSSDDKKKKSTSTTNHDNEYEREKRRQAAQDRKERVEKWNHLIDGYVTDKEVKNSLHVTKVTDIPSMHKEIEMNNFREKYKSYQLAKLQYQQAINTYHHIDNLIKELS